MSVSPASRKHAFETLRGFSRKPPGERCELCGLPLPKEHAHVLQRADGQILCACDPCAILFSYREEGGKFVRIPRDVRRLGNFQMTDAEWAAFRLPIDLAFFVRSTSAGRVLAYYPSPAGSTESLLSLEAWDGIVRGNPTLARMAPDVECLMVNRTRGQREYYIAPLDECYRLTGLIRLGWRGFSGGDEVWRGIDDFFAALQRRAQTGQETAHA